MELSVNTLFRRCFHEVTVVKKNCFHFALRFSSLPSLRENKDGLDRQRSTLLYRDEKRSCHDMLRATPNARVPPCHLGDSECKAPPSSICPTLNISWNDLRLHCLDRQRSTLLYRDEKRSFHDMLRATPNARVPPCHLGFSECKAPPCNLSRP